MIDMKELSKVSEYLGGRVIFESSDGTHFICVDTGDNTSKENYDDMLEDASHIEKMLSEYEICDMWADHDTQIFTFKKVEA